MNKPFKTQKVRELLNQVLKEEISFSRFVEILNETSEIKPYTKDQVSDLCMNAFESGYNKGLDEDEMSVFWTFERWSKENIK